jgi:hypothetical protein
MLVTSGFRDGRFGSWRIPHLPPPTDCCAASWRRGAVWSRLTLSCPVTWRAAGAVRAHRVGCDGPKPSRSQPGGPYRAGRFGPHRRVTWSHSPSLAERAFRTEGDRLDSQTGVSNEVVRPAWIPMQTPLCSRIPRMPMSRSRHGSTKVPAGSSGLGNGVHLPNGASSFPRALRSSTASRQRVGRCHLLDAGTVSVVLTDSASCMTRSAYSPD